MKSAASLKENPVVDLNGGNRPLPELPVKKIAELLTTTEGRILMQNSRINRSMIEAVLFVHPFAAGFDDDYAEGLMTDMLNLSIGLDGQGRKDLTECLRAGGAVPDAYYTGGQNNGRAPRSDASYIRYGAESE